MLTLIGTLPTIVIAEVWEEAGHELLSFFTFLPAGLICVTAGTLLLIPLVNGFLNRKAKHDQKDGNMPKSLAELVDEYGLLRDLYKAPVSADSPIVGKTIVPNLRVVLGIDVLEVREDGSRHDKRVASAGLGQTL